MVKYSHIRIFDSRTPKEKVKFKYISSKYWIHSIEILFLAFSLGSCITMNKFSKGKLQKSQVESYSFPFQSIDGIIVLDVTVNGVTGKFMLDNGFSLCAIDERFAAKANVAFNRTGSVKDANSNNIRLAETKINSISVGPFELKNSFVNELNTQLFLPCDSIDGVLGASFINRLNWKVDFENKLATISTKEFEIDGVYIPLKFGRNNIAYAEFEINDKSIKTMVDFGYQGHFQIHKKHLSTMNGQFAEVRAGIQSLSVSGLGNIDTSYSCSNIPVKFEKFQLVNTSELVVKSNLGEDAVVGINYFENFTMCINNSSKKLALQERANFTFPQKPNFNASLYVVEGEIRVMQINLNDPIHQRITLMETVQRIDDRPSEEFLDVCYLKAYMKHKRLKNEPVTIQLNGSDAKYVLHSGVTEKLLISVGE